MLKWAFGVFLVINLGVDGAAAEPLRIAVFEADATPPLGTPLSVKPASRIVDPLETRGVVLLGDGPPVVLCAVDWIGISNGGHRAWRVALAEAAGTSPDRVAVHALHQHDAPGCDFTAELLMEGRASTDFHAEFAGEAIRKAAHALRRAMTETVPVTHIGTGVGAVERVASNRRVLGAEGKVIHVRWSATRDEEARAAPEGVVDPEVRLLSFWNQDRPVAALTYYATHPQSYYGEGEVSADFVGIARRLFQDTIPAFALHFNGAGGNVTAGKYNDGSPENRPLLAGRLAQGMQRAWEATRRVAVEASQLSWETWPVDLPPAAHLKEADLRERLRLKPDWGVAADLAWVRRSRTRDPIELSCLALGPVRILHMPGELFVEYQLAAQRLRPDLFVAMAAYGDYGPGYIGTRVSYPQGGYEVGPVSRVSPEAEQVLLDGMMRLLEVSDPPSVTPSDITLQYPRLDDSAPAWTRADPYQEPVEPLFQTVDLDEGETREVALPGGSKVKVRLLAVRAGRDSILGAIDQVEVDLELQGEKSTLPCGLYSLPAALAAAQVDCPATLDYLSDSQSDAWGLDKRARLRLWPPESPWIRPGTFRYPVRQRWFASDTWYSNEPVAKRPQGKFYYHSGLDIGAAEGLAEVVSATDGLVVVSGREQLDLGSRSHPEMPPDGANVWIRDARGWYHYYTHLKSIDAAIRPGARVLAGTRLGLVGKESGSGGWSHLHYEIKSLQPSGRWGTQDGYAFLWQSYREQHRPSILAVARPRHTARVGETVTLEAGRSWAQAGIQGYRWLLSDGREAAGERQQRTYDAPGTYSEILEVTDRQGRLGYDFARVRVEARDADVTPPGIHAAFYPTTGIRAGDPVIFQVRARQTQQGADEWDFGDGSPSIQVRSNQNPENHAPDGYVSTVHAFSKAGDYLVRVQRRDDRGYTATAHLHVRVDP